MSGFSKAKSMLFGRLAEFKIFETVTPRYKGSAANSDSIQLRDVSNGTHAGRGRSGRVKSRYRCNVRRRARSPLFVLSVCLIVYFIALHIYLMKLISQDHSYSSTNEEPGDDILDRMKNPRLHFRELENVDTGGNSNSIFSYRELRLPRLRLEPNSSRKDLGNLVPVKDSDVDNRNVGKSKKKVPSRDVRVQGKTSNTSDTRSRVKYLIYLCDGSRSCGGWGDRQRGLVSAFLLANVTRRRFGINMTVPCDVTNYYVPNKVNWRISESELRGRSNRVIHSVDDDTFHYSLLKTDFENAYKEDVIFLRTNIEHFWTIRSNPYFTKVLPRWAKFGRPLFFREAWNILMKPSSYLQNHLEPILTDSRFYNRTSPFVCAHVRIGRSRNNPTDTESRNDVSQLGSLWRFLESYAKNGSHIYLATDNTEVREISRQKFGFAHHDSGGVIAHIDKRREEKDGCKGFEYALLDQLVLTHCDVLVTSHSMFGSRAALIRGTNSGLYYYHNGTIEKTKLK
ncbi:hypothetical protein BaRGS_00028656 [Batillaria attramentaria]|uniref:Uncharacterized protein n=1 Tax=Batillaria attramentaria TaxID=370345 RepID=A0ABD0JYH9_9CAEN